MQYRALGQTDLKVSNICLGTMTWGSQNTEAEGHIQMDYALDQGINFIDTAEMYASPPTPETQGSTEEIVGSWLNARKNRDQVILATKVAGRSPLNWLRDGGKNTEQSKAQIHEAIDKSLKRLQTDYIDLYQLHWPDRPMQLFGGLNYKHIQADSHPIKEILEVLEGLVQAGKVRHVGLSNETPWGVSQFLKASEARGYTRVASIQNVYNLVSRAFEMGLSEFVMREQVGLLAYSPLAQGYLTGKYRDGALPEGARKTLYDRLQRYEGTGAEKAINSYLDLAKDRGIDPVHLALKFCDTRPFVTSTIIGATSLAQLKHDIEAFDVPWPEDLEEAVNALHLEQPNPCP